MEIQNTISGDTYIVRAVVAVERESTNDILLSAEDLQTDEWEVSTDDE